MALLYQKILLRYKSNSPFEKPQKQPSAFSDVVLFVSFDFCLFVCLFLLQNSRKVRWNEESVDNPHNEKYDFTF